MKKKKIITLTTIAGVTVLTLWGAYMYAIQGEKLGDRDDSWIRKIPIAHRGLDNGDVPENSMLAFREAIEHGYTIELDVQLTKDKQLVVFHDSNLERLTGDSRDISDVDYAELKELKLEGTEETIPTLKEVLELVDDQVPLLIEIKNGKNAKELAEKTYELTRDYKGRYMVQSFDPFILEWFKNNASEVIRCQLSCDFEGEQNGHLKWYEKFLLKNLMLNIKSKPHVIGYDINAIDNLPVKLLKSEYPVIAWTIKDEADMEKGYDKVDNIIFDNILP